MSIAKTVSWRGKKGMILGKQLVLQKYYINLHVNRQLKQIATGWVTMVCQIDTNLRKKITCIISRKER